MFEIVESIKRVHELRTTQITDEEVNESVRALNAMKEGLGDRLREIYSAANFTGKVGLTDAVEDLANAYLRTIKPTKRKAREIKDDLRIAACATLDTIDYVLTFNRRTLASEEFQIAYRKVNDARNLKTPTFLTTIESFRRLLM